MAGQHFEQHDARNASLLNVVGVIERDLARLPTQTSAEDGETLAEVRAFWGELVGLLALEPALELRECPSCKQVGMRSATRCGYCWIKLVPPGSSS
jgi:hypothetical protein